MIPQPINQPDGGGSRARQFLEALFYVHDLDVDYPVLSAHVSKLAEIINTYAHQEVLAEREACAKASEEYSQYMGIRIAKAIRERSNRSKEGV